MGLDNGIMVKNIKLADLPNQMEVDIMYEYDDGVEIAYWRKCWDIRNDVLRLVFPELYAADAMTYRFPLTPEKLLGIIDIVDWYIHHPTDWQNSIWTWNEYLPILQKNKLNLLLFHAWWEKHPSVEAYFYDSF